MNRDLILIRGVSGSGKSTFAEFLYAPIFSADDYFMRNGKYEFDANKLGAAHLDCQTKTANALKKGTPRVVVANTFTTVRELKPYIELGKKYGYRVFTIVVENRHGGINVHNVPAATLAKQKGRFDIQL